MSTRTSNGLLAELAAQGASRKVAQEGDDVFGIGTDPSISIGQRRLLSRVPGANVLWDMGTYVDDQLSVTSPTSAA